MNRPTPVEILDVMEATWPPARRSSVGHWSIREGQGGGRRVSATTGDIPSDIDAAEAAMSAMGQADIFMIRDGDTALDQTLADLGYQADAPTSLFCCPVALLASQPVPPLSAFTLWPPLAIMDEIWEAGGIGPERRAIMGRVKVRKTAVLGRSNNRAAGTAFVAIHHNIAMIHAIEVASTQRRLGAGINIMRAAALWAQDHGARFFTLLVTDANAPANALYRKLGLSVVGHYHYRVRQKQ